MSTHEDLLRSRPLLLLPVLGIAVAVGLATVTSSDVLDTLLGVVAGGLTVAVVAIALAMAWRALHPVVSTPDDRLADGDRAALDALEPLRAARDDR